MKPDRFFAPRTSPITRREMLRQAGLVTAGLALTPASGWPATWFRADEVVVPFTDVPDTFTGRRGGVEQFPGQSLIAQDLRKLTSWTTPIEDFFVVAHYNIPELDASAYRLQISGLTARPLTLTLEQLMRRPRVERTTVFECGGNRKELFHGMVGNAVWGGVELRPLLEEAGPTSDAREVYFWGADAGPEEIRGEQFEQNFARSMSLAEVMETNPILAFEMNGRPLPVAHGYPVRLIVPGWYGVAQVKWLDRIELGADRLMTRFMARDYVTLMGRETNGETEWVETSVTRQRIKSAIARVTRSDDRFRIFGVAWSDGTPLDRVEVQVDGGEWRVATLERQENPHAWTFFSLDTTGLAPGEHRLVSRAFDARGRTQPVNLDTKKTRWENNELFPRTILVS